LRLAVCVFGLRDPEPVPPVTLAGINSRARTRWHARIAAARAAAGNANHPETAPSTSPPLIEHDMGTGWATSTPDRSPGFLADVACPSVGECWAVGSLIERYAGSRWAVVSNAAPTAAPGTGSGVLDAVTCADANDCWAVGNSGDLLSGGQTLIEHYSGSSWTIFGLQ